MKTKELKSEIQDKVMDKFLYCAMIKRWMCVN